MEPLLRRVLQDTSVPSQLKVLAKAKLLIKEDPAFQGLQPPTHAEVRAFLADKPRWQAKAPVPEFPGRNQLGSRPLEILGADLIEKDKTTINVTANRDMVCCRL